MTFGEKLSRLRKESNYTQEQLADILDVSRQSVSKWESDIVYPETDKLIKIGKIFGCSMDYLLAVGVFSLGLLAIGSIAIGLFAAGAISVGLVSFGALSIGCFSTGALAVGKYAAVGDHAYGMIAIGRSVAEGSVYSHIGDLTTADIPKVVEWLDENV